MASVKVSLTTQDLERIHNLYGMAWGRESKTALKLQRALERSQKEKPND